MSLDRLSLDQEDIAAYRLVRHDNALFTKKLADNTRRGLHDRAEASFSAGGVTFGYAVAWKFDQAGELVRCARRIMETEAVIVRRIFGNYADGLSQADRDDAEKA